MNDSNYPGSSANSHPDNVKLSAWLQQIMKLPATEPQHIVSGNDDTALELQLNSNYHIRFYQQLPDFAMALLQNDSQAMLKYADLLYHLAGCDECHEAYLELYDALREAVYPQGFRPQLGQGTKTLAATPQRMLRHLCQALISQAEALFQQGRREHRDYIEPARSLLQQALSISSHIGQNGIRHHALQDLVRVANLFEGANAIREDDPRSYVYTPVVSGAGGTRGGKKILRHVETPLRSPGKPAGQPVILIQARGLEGRITQNEQTLFLDLQDLSQELRGHYVKIIVPLGALLEPVRWIGGNPRAIRSTIPVDMTGKLTIPLGETALKLTNNEERNLLEAMFMLLEVRAID
ncbi:MAG: hypothetical protein H0V70_01490 [Ktedonobacteraceae bacterium]|nr:hypothetical protein [Ktedonobacteraceae bacterium]